MTIKRIYLESVDDINRFLNVTEKCPYPVDLRSGNQVVDAKSALGVMAMGLGREIDFCAHVPQLEPEVSSGLSFCMK